VSGRREVSREVDILTPKLVDNIKKRASTSQERERLNAVVCDGLRRNERRMSENSKGERLRMLNFLNKRTSRDVVHSVARQGEQSSGELYREILGHRDTLKRFFAQKEEGKKTDDLLSGKDPLFRREQKGIRGALFGKKRRKV